MRVLNNELKNSNDEHKKLWWVYFVLTNDILKQNISIKDFYKNGSMYLTSFKNGKQMFFSDFKDASLFQKPEENMNYPIAKYLDIYLKT